MMTFTQIIAIWTPGISMQDHLKAILVRIEVIQRGSKTISHLLKNYSANLLQTTDNEISLLICYILFHTSYRMMNLFT